MKQVELLDVPAPHVPYTRVPLPKSGLRIGGTGSDVQVQSILGYCRLELVGGQIQARFSGVGTANVFPAGVVEISLSLATLWVRVVDDAVLPAGWPAHPACAGAEGAAPGAGATQVLVDALLEAGHPFGEALRMVGDRRVALAQFAVLRDFGELELGFESGLVEHAIIRGGARGLRSFSRHALLHLVRRIDLVAYDPADALDALATGPLPWLEELRIHHVASKRMRALEKKAKAFFPRARPVLLPPQRLGVETRKQVEPLPTDRAIVLDATGTTAGGIRVIDRFVRWSSGVPMLGLANGELTLNGRALVRPPRNPTWGVALMAGDVFTVDGVERKVVVVQ